MAREKLVGVTWPWGAAFLASLTVGLSANGGAQSPIDLVPPVKVLEHVERIGPDFYRYDWPVAPGAWPTIKDGELEYPVGAYGGGFNGGPYYDSLPEWWRKSGFDFAEAAVHVDYTVTGKEAAESYRRDLLDPAKLGGVMSSMCLGIFYDPSKKGRLPTIPEMRSQVYQCVVAGVQQLLWFHYAEWLKDKYGRKDLHDELERLNRELHILTGPIYSSLRCPVSIPSEQDKEKYQRDFYATASLYRNALYVIALRVAGESEMKPVARKAVRIQLHLPPQTSGRLADEAVVLFDRMGSQGDDSATYCRDGEGDYRRVAVRPEGVIVDDFGEYEVHVYRIRLARKHKDSQKLPTLKK